MSDHQRMQSERERKQHKMHDYAIPFRSTSTKKFICLILAIMFR